MRPLEQMMINLVILVVLFYIGLKVFKNEEHINLLLKQAVNTKYYFDQDPSRVECSTCRK